MGEHKTVDLLLKESAGSIKWHLDVKNLSRAFVHACTRKNSELMDTLIERGAEVNEADIPLMIAPEQGGEREKDEGETHPGGFLN